MKRKKLSCIALLLLMFFAFGIAAESVALAAPIGEWKFDEGSGTIAYDSSGKGKTGTITGATWIDGLLNKALKFAGSTNYVKVPQSLDGLSNWSFASYIKPTGTGEVKIYSEKDDKNDFYFYISITADDRIKVGTWHGERPGWDIYQTPVNKVKRNEWSHLCVTLENGGATAGSGTVKCYVNRILVEPTGRLGSCQALVPVTGVSLNKTSTTLNAGSTEALIATVSPANATNKNVTWSSSNTAVATVSNGTVTAKAVGTATITVRTADGGKTATCTVTVPHVVGASWTVGPNTTLTRLGNAVGKSPGADFDNIYPWSGIKQEQVMIKIPKFYYKHTYSGGKHEFWITKAPLNGFKLHPAFKRGSVEKDYILVGANKFGEGQTIAQCKSTAQGYGMSIIDIQTWSAIQMLQLIEFANIVGSTNYRGINGLYSGTGQWIEGLSVSGGKYYVAGNNTNFTVPGNGFITDWHHSDAYDWLFLPKAVGGNKSTYIPDYFRSGSNIAVAGFSWPHCACRIYCSYCQAGQHGYCRDRCFCLNGWCYGGRHELADNSCGRPAVGGSCGLFAWDLYGTPGAGSPFSTRFLYIPE